MVDVGDVAVLLQPLLVRLRAVGGVGPHRRAGVAAIEHVAELRPVIGRGAGDVPSADEAVAAIDGGMLGWTAPDGIECATMRS